MIDLANGLSMGLLVSFLSGNGVAALQFDSV